MFKKLNGAEHRREAIPLRSEAVVPSGDRQGVGEGCRGGPEGKVLEGGVALEEL